MCVPCVRESRKVAFAERLAGFEQRVQALARGLRLGRFLHLHQSVTAEVRGGVAEHLERVRGSVPATLELAGEVAVHWLRVGPRGARVVPGRPDVRIAARDGSAVGGRRGRDVDAVGQTRRGRRRRRRRCGHRRPRPRKARGGGGGEDITSPGTRGRLPFLRRSRVEMPVVAQGGGHEGHERSPGRSLRGRHGTEVDDPGAPPRTVPRTVKKEDG